MCKTLALFIPVYYTRVNYRFLYNCVYANVKQVYCCGVNFVCDCPCVGLVVQLKLPNYESGLFAVIVT